MAAKWGGVGSSEGSGSDEQLLVTFLCLVSYKTELRAEGLLRARGTLQSPTDHASRYHGR
jgi:hypothetical protein